MNAKQKKECHTIIHTASVAAGGVGAGLAQIPGSDNAVIIEERNHNFKRGWIMKR